MHFFVHFSTEEQGISQKYEHIQVWVKCTKGSIHSFCCWINQSLSGWKKCDKFQGCSKFEILKLLSFHLYDVADHTYVCSPFKSGIFKKREHQKQFGVCETKREERLKKEWQKRTKKGPNQLKVLQRFAWVQSTSITLSFPKIVKYQVCTLSCTHLKFGGPKLQMQWSHL